MQVWPVRLTAPDDAVDDFRSLLAEPEKERAERFAFEHLRRSFILSRGVLRILLGRYIGMAPAAITFAYGAHGKPHVPVETRVRFNSSHSGDLAVFAFTQDCEIGVDVERVRSLPDMQDIARRFFCPEEEAELADGAPSDRAHAFFLCWTRKEAFIKATGDGLSAALDSFRVSLRPGDRARIIRVGDGSGAGWAMHNLEPGPGYAGALAYCGPERSMDLMPVRSAVEWLPA